MSDDMNRGENRSWKHAKRARKEANMATEEEKISSNAASRRYSTMP